MVSAVVAVVAGMVPPLVAAAMVALGAYLAAVAVQVGLLAQLVEMVEMAVLAPAARYEYGGGREASTMDRIAELEQRVATLERQLSYQSNTPNEIRYCPGGPHGGGCGLPLRDAPGRRCISIYENGGGGSVGLPSGGGGGR